MKRMFIRLFLRHAVLSWPVTAGGSVEFHVLVMIGKTGVGFHIQVHTYVFTYFVRRDVKQQ